MNTSAEQLKPGQELETPPQSPETKLFTEADLELFETEAINNARSEALDIYVANKDVLERNPKPSAEYIDQLEDLTSEAEVLCDAFEDAVRNTESTETKEASSAEVMKAKKEIFERAGERSPEEVMELISSVHEIFKNEKERGAGKLQDSIKAIEDGPNGKEYFVDGSVAYLPREGEATFVGDTHGDAESTASIIEQAGFIENMEDGDGTNKIVFLGDYADRGSKQSANLETIFALKEKYPNNVTLLRGNHEEINIGVQYGFLKSLGQDNGVEEGGKLFERYNEIFKDMPGVVVAANGVVAAHAGIPSRDIGSLKEINDPDVLEEMRWNDPAADIQNRSEGGNRGVKNSRKFGEKSFSDFMDTVGGSTMIRSHETVKDGQATKFNNKLVTVFSSGGEKGQSSGYSSRVEAPKFAKLDMTQDKSTWNADDFADISYDEPDYGQEMKPKPATETPKDKPTKPKGRRRDAIRLSPEEAKAMYASIDDAKPDSPEEQKTSGGVDWGSF